MAAIHDFGSRRKHLCRRAGSGNGPSVPRKERRSSARIDGIEVSFGQRQAAHWVSHPTLPKGSMHAASNAPCRRGACYGFPCDPCYGRLSGWKGNGIIASDILAFVSSGTHMEDAHSGLTQPTAFV